MANWIGNTATFSFRPCEDDEFCDYQNVETLQSFQRWNGGTALTTAVRKKAYWVNRELNYQGLLPGGDCKHDYQCLSGRCHDICKGLYNDESCLSSDECDHGYYCYVNGTTSQTWQKEIDVGQDWTEGTDVCTQGYVCANIGGVGSKCVELFSRPDGVSSTQANACLGGFKTGGNVCYSIRYAANTAGSAILASPYSWDINSGISSWRAFDFSGTAITNSIPCLCSFTTATTQGYWAYDGYELDYRIYFDRLKNAIKASRWWHTSAFSWILDLNLLSSSYFTSTFPETNGFGNWYDCISEPQRLNDFLAQMRKLLGYPGRNSAVYQQCLEHPSLNVYDPQHWCPNSDRCSSSGLVPSLALVLILLILSYSI